MLKRQEQGGVILYSFRIFLSAALIFLVSSFLSIQKSVAETYRVYGVVSGDVLYIRAWPSIKSKKIGSIPPYGKGVERLGPCKGSWCKVSYQGMTGWTSMKYLTREASAGSSYRVRGIKSNDVLYIRARPSAKSKKVGSIPPYGKGVEKLGPCKRNWCKINYRGITGWSSMMYLVADTMGGHAAPTPPPTSVTPHPTLPASKKSRAALAALVSASLNFQAMATTDFPKALSSFSSGKGNQRLSDINSAIWKASISQLGWMIYFNSAIRVMGDSPNRLPMVSYYNPFSDVMLITVWKRQRGAFRIVDAEIVLGDLLRQPLKKPSYKPPLSRLMTDDGHWHAATGFSVARTTLAFEKRLANADPQVWRQGLLIFNGPDAVLDLNMSGVTILLNAHLVNIGQYIEPETSNAKLAKTRKIVTQTISLLASGRVDQALQSARTRPPSHVVKALKRLPAKWFKSLSVSIAASHNSNYIVFLTPPDTTNISMALTVLNPTGGAYLDRIGLIDFQGFYAPVKKHQQRQ